MWRVQVYRAVGSVLHKNPELRNWLLRKSYLYRVVPLLLNFNRLSDRQYMIEGILPALASAKVHRVLFVGCKPYTARYGKKLTRAAIDYWTTDIDPAAAIWGEKGHHIICDVTKIDDICPPEWFDAVLLNGVFGSGVDEESEMNHAVEAIAHILRPNGIFLIGWNSQKKHPDPTELEAVTIYFRRERVLPLPLRKTFPDTDHVYDWLVKTNFGQDCAGTQAISHGLVKN